jgi:hypothetical protein
MLGERPGAARGADGLGCIAWDRHAGVYGRERALRRINVHRFNTADRIVDRWYGLTCTGRVPRLPATIVVGP